ILEEDAVRNIVQQCLEDISLAGQGLPCALVLGNLLAQGLVYLGQVAGPLLNELLQFLSKLLRPFFHCLVVNTARHIRGRGSSIFGESGTAGRGSSAIWVIFRLVVLAAVGSLRHDSRSVLSYAVVHAQGVGRLRNRSAA